VSAPSSALPVDVDDLTPAWFSAVLQRDVRDVTVLDRSSGTTGRARVARHGEPGLPATVFVKLPPFDERQRALVDKTGMGVAESAVLPRPRVRGRGVRDLVQQLAALHAPFWQSPRFASSQDLAWLAERGMHRGGGGRAFIQQPVDVLGEHMDETSHRLAHLSLTATRTSPGCGTRGRRSKSASG
jgi:hypothetical protein